jgi:UDP-glucose:(heptosyl)LPS alpha-1,3-glucosyltransferase
MREDYRNETRSYWHINPGTFLIGLVTSGAFQLRGVDIAIKAYAGLPKSVRADTRMVIVGNNSQIAQYRQQVSSLGLSDLIFFYPASRKIERCYHALDALIHPARLETFGLVVQEAMACGVPVITNRQVGAAELLPPEARTQLAEFPDVDDLKEKLEKMICDHQFRQRWKEYGNTAVAANTEQVYFERVLEIYRAAGL